jgi:hypothetical protein
MPRGATPTRPLSRDFLLIVSGTIFGLGGAFFIEWIKSRLERN